MPPPRSASAKPRREPEAGSEDERRSRERLPEHRRPLLRGGVPEPCVVFLLELQHRRAQLRRAAKAAQLVICNEQRCLAASVATAVELLLAIELLEHARVKASLSARVFVSVLGLESYLLLFIIIA